MPFISSMTLGKLLNYSASVTTAGKGELIVPFYGTVTQIKLTCISRALETVPSTEVSKLFLQMMDQRVNMFSFVGHVVCGVATQHCLAVWKQSQIIYH